MSWTTRPEYHRQQIPCPSRSASSSSESSITLASITTSSTKEHKNCERKVRWTPCTVDNESLGRRSTKASCFHPRILSPRTPSVERRPKKSVRFTWMSITSHKSDRTRLWEMRCDSVGITQLFQSLTVDKSFISEIYNFDSRGKNLCTSRAL